MKLRLVLLTIVALSLTIAATALSAPERGNDNPFHAKFTFTTSVPSNPAPCAELRIDVSGSGVATKLGRFETVQHHCLTSADPLAFSDGEYRFTGANGDTIHGTYSGRFAPTEVAGTFAIDARFTIDGGTGRFARATGGGLAGGTATQAGGTVILDGTICLPRHGRRNSCA